jgi:hypothetical protein
MRVGPYGGGSVAYHYAYENTKFLLVSSLFFVVSKSILKLSV